MKAGGAEGCGWVVRAWATVGEVGEGGGDGGVDGVGGEEVGEGVEDWGLRTVGRRTEISDSKERRE